ncbi:MAG: hypothetical protein JRI36_07860 [Deltaproteobacteria bacterium]|nr:hypothetical protein [Deltaproteobacteria bacterium]
MGAIGSNHHCLGSKDTLVKVLAAVFLNPEDRTHEGRKVFIQQFLGCGCPDAVVEKAGVAFFVRPLGALLDRRIARQRAGGSVTPLEKRINGLLSLPEGLMWPRRASGAMLLPGQWRRPMLKQVTKDTRQLERLSFLRTLCRASIDAVIEVPDRAFFFLVVSEGTRLKPSRLRVQFECGQLLYKILGYNRCRLFTVTDDDGPKIIPQIDTPLSWAGLRHAFFEARNRYAFAFRVLDLLSPID